MKKISYVISLLALLLPSISFASQTQCPVLKTYTQADFQQAFASNQPTKGVLVKLSKNQKSYYLYGTIHNTTLDNINLGNDVIQAVNHATGVAVETDISDPSNQAALQDTKKIKLSKQTKALFAKLEKQYCINDAKYASASSIEKAYYLAMYANAVNGYFFGFGADSIIMNTAKKLGKPITSLEMPQQQQAMLSQYDDNVVKHILQSVESQAVVRQMQQIDKTWVKGDITALSAMKDSYTDESIDYVNNLMSDSRDKNLATKIDEFYQTHDNGFAAIGVMHLVGKHNVIDYLAKQGYQVSYIYPTKQRESKNI